MSEDPCEKTKLHPNAYFYVYGNLLFVYAPFLIYRSDLLD